jgi:hypothetical protein
MTYRRSVSHGLKRFSAVSRAYVLSWTGEVRGAMAAPSVCGLQGFMGLGNRNLVLWYPETAQKRLEKRLEERPRNA